MNEKDKKTMRWLLTVVFTHAQMTTHPAIGDVPLIVTRAENAADELLKRAPADMDFDS